MEWLIVIAIGICLIWLALSSRRPARQPSVAQTAKPDGDLRDELEKVRQERNAFVSELINLRGQLKRLILRNGQIEPQLKLALEIIPLMAPPEWINEYGLVLDPRDTSVSRDHVKYRRIFHDWTVSAIQTWESIDALSTDSKRGLEEACRATLRDDTGAGTHAYATTPLLTETVRLLRTTPDIIKINLFELRSADLQKFALWLDIFERLGRERYFRLREHAGNLLAQPLDPPDAPQSETLD